MRRGSIHLLKSLINADKLDSRMTMWQVMIHATFLVSALALALVDRLLVSAGV